MLRDLGPQLRRGAIPVEPLPRCPTGIHELDRLLGGGFPRGRLSEIAGPTSCGRTSLALHLLARTTRAGEVAAVVDAADAFDPASAEAAGARLDRVLWVRPPQPREALRSTERLLEAHGFALILLDLPPARSLRSQARRARSEPPASEVTAQARRARSGLSDSGKAEGRAVSQRRTEAGPCQDGRAWKSAPEPTSLPPLPPATSVWLRLTRAAAGTGTALVVLSPMRTLGAAAELALQLKPTQAHFTGTPTLLEGLDIEVALVRHRSAPADRSAHLHLTTPGA